MAIEKKKKEPKFKTVTDTRMVAPHKIEQRKGDGWKDTGKRQGSAAIMTRERKVEVTE